MDCANPASPRVSVEVETVKAFLKRVIPPSARRFLRQRKQDFTDGLCRSSVWVATLLTRNPDEICRFALEAQEFTPQVVVLGLHQGIFPAPEKGTGKLIWHDPDPRGILPIEGFHVPRSLRRVIRQRLFEITVNTRFDQVIEMCAERAPGREQTWMTPSYIEMVKELHRMGLAHSVEVWQNGQMVGGDVGYCLGGCFMGISAFHRVPDASSVALAYVTEMLEAGGFVLHDASWLTDYLTQFGAQEIPRAEFKRRLAHALIKPAQLEPLSMDEFVQRVQQRREREVQATQVPA